MVPAIVKILLNLPLVDDDLYHYLIVLLGKMAETNADIKQQIVLNEGIKLGLLARADLKEQVQRCLNRTGYNPIESAQRLVQRE